MTQRFPSLFLLFVLYCAFSLSAFAPLAQANSPEANTIAQAINVGEGVIYKGEAKFVDIYHPAFTQAELTWQGKKITYSRQDNEDNPKWKALLSLGLQSKAQTVPLNIRYSDGKNTQTVTLNFTVKEKDYPVQKLTVEPKYASPPASVLERIKKDQKEIRDAFATISPVRHWELPLARPVEGVTTSEYGLRREFNGQKRNPHRGLDLDGKLNDTIIAVESGKVILVADHYYGGKTVVIDHGLGVLSAYLHMNSFLVSQGQDVVRGQAIGAVGKTGRVTGPHLHLSLSVLGQSINPNPLLSPRKTQSAGHPQ